MALPMAAPMVAPTTNPIEPKADIAPPRSVGEEFTVGFRLLIALSNFDKYPPQEGRLVIDKHLPGPARLSTFDELFDKHLSGPPEVVLTC